MFSNTSYFMLLMLSLITSLVADFGAKYIQVGHARSGHIRSGLVSC